MSGIDDSLKDSLLEFVNCEHSHWKCCKCGCTTDEGSVAWRYRQRINDLEVELENQREGNATLRSEIRRLKKSGNGLVRMFNTATDERNAAREVARHFAECMRNGNRPNWSECVEKHPWLKPEAEL